ncbi:hypothetical protein ACIQU1_20585 [Streptomyces angustmyceticus]|uniref:hypothetical protein n=1 Tax=Streptomyces angustmyceticus TaxID=285578 RepID=UPI00381C9294
MRSFRRLHPGTRFNPRNGYRVMEMDRAAELGDLFTTVTSNKNVLRAEHFARLPDPVPDDAIVCNPGHVDVGIDVPALRAAAGASTSSGTPPTWATGCTPCPRTSTTTWHTSNSGHCASASTP